MTLGNPGPRPSMYGEPIKTASSALRDMFTRMDRSEITREKLAAKAGVSPVTLWNWRNGRRNPRMCEVECVAEVLGYELILRRKRP